MANGLKLAEVDQRLASTTQDTIKWQAQMRAVMLNSISPEDIQAIVATQVKRAKDGDQAAIKFVMQQVLGANTPVTIRQTNVITDVASAARLVKGA